MTIPRALASFLAALAALVIPCGRQAQAGDPCPITFRAHDLGTPPCLDLQAVLGSLEAKSHWIGIKYRHDEPPVHITQIYSGSPAEAAGLLAGDVLLQVGKLSIEDEATATRAFDALQPGQPTGFKIRREQSVLEKPLTVRMGDPLVRMLVKANQKRGDCVEAYQEPTPLDLTKLQPALFTDKREFRCDDAHHRLKRHLPTASGAGDIVIVRGRRRVLLALVGWKTLCVRAADYDGAKLTDRRMQSLLDQLTGERVQERFRNP
jgi:hypothetical protein